MKHTDTRVQYTKHALHEALISLLLTKPVARVSVKELCDTAGINRGTFYLHYDTPEDILTELQHEFLKENEAIFLAYWNSGRDLDLMAQLFSCLDQNRRLCRVLFGPNGNPYFVKNIKDLAREQTLTEWKAEFPRHSDENLRFIYDFLFDGAMRLIVKWISGEQDISAEELTHRLEVIGHHCLLAAGVF